MFCLVKSEPILICTKYWTVTNNNRKGHMQGGKLWVKASEHSNYEIQNLSYFITPMSFVECMFMILISLLLANILKKSALVTEFTIPI
jgi:hypothetical protein